jgi:hypothetical protein
MIENDCFHHQHQRGEDQNQLEFRGWRGWGWRAKRILRCSFHSGTTAYVDFRHGVGKQEKWNTTKDSPHENNQLWDIWVSTHEMVSSIVLCSFPRTPSAQGNDFIASNWCGCPTCMHLFTLLCRYHTGACTQCFTQHILDKTPYVALRQPGLCLRQKFMEPHWNNTERLWGRSTQNHAFALRKLQTITRGYPRSRRGPPMACTKLSASSKLRSFSRHRCRPSVSWPFLKGDALDGHE